MHPKHPARQGPPPRVPPTTFALRSVSALGSGCPRVSVSPSLSPPPRPPPSFEVFLDLSLLPLYLSLLLSPCAPRSVSPPRHPRRAAAPALNAPPPYLSAQACSTYPSPWATLLGAGQAWKPAPPPRP